MAEAEWYRFTVLIYGTPRDYQQYGERLGDAMAASLGYDAGAAAARALFENDQPISIDNPHLVRAVAPDEVFDLYAAGLVFCAACTSLDDDSLVVRVNASHPTGVASEWRVHPEPFETGEANPHPCPERPGCRHVLFSC